MNLREHLGPIDIYLLDQLLKGRLLPGMSLLDAGCGSGRNLVYFLRHGYEVYGVDESPQAVEQVRLQGRWYALPDGTERFLVDEGMLERRAAQLGGIWLEPLKTTVVQNQRLMTTWVLQKRSEGSTFL